MNGMTIQSYIGLGSNLEGVQGRPSIQLDKAISAMNELIDTQVIQVSSYYQTAPIGPEGQSDYVNAVAHIETQLTADHLLTQLQRIEKEHERIRIQKWGARTLDLDILLYGEDILQTSRLTIPHPQMAFRSFVLIPLHEITGDDFFIPQLGSIMNVITHCPENPIFRMP